MLEQNVIETAQTKWAATIVFALKKWRHTLIQCQIQETQCDNKKKFVSGSSNWRMIWIVFAKPLCFPCLIQTLDVDMLRLIKKTYEKDGNTTLFTYHHFIYRFIRMLFGLWNAPGIFQRSTDVVFSLFKRQFVFAYLVDIVISTKFPEQNVNHFHRVLSLFQNAGISMQFKKYWFFTETADHFWHLVPPKRLEIALHTANAK